MQSALHVRLTDTAKHLQQNFEARIATIEQNLGAQMAAIEQVFEVQLASAAEGYERRLSESNQRLAAVQMELSVAKRGQMRLERGMEDLHVCREEMKVELRNELKKQRQEMHDMKTELKELRFSCMAKVAPPTPCSTVVDLIHFTRDDAWEHPPVMDQHQSALLREPGVQSRPQSSASQRTWAPEDGIFFSKRSTTRKPKRTAATSREKRCSSSASSWVSRQGLFETTNEEPKEQGTIAEWASHDFGI
jgi:hypothetical protein